MKHIQSSLETEAVGCEFSLSLYGVPPEVFISLSMRKKWALNTLFFFLLLLLPLLPLTY
jgi:hypothetical protein